MTAVFTAWMNYRHRADDYMTRKKYVAGFVPRLVMFERSVKSLLESCPQAKIISVIREPRSWYASAKRHHSSYNDLAEAMRLWANCARASKKLAYDLPASCKQIYFHDLVQNPTSTMREISDFVGLSWSDTLLKPTFNGGDIPSDSSFVPTVGVVDNSVTDRWHNHLTVEEAGAIEQFVRRYTEFGYVLSRC
jgi:hypothetical protein